jgi:ribosomal protein L37E
MNIESMSTTQTTGATAAGQSVTERCGQCGVPAAHDQRYCLNCGFHRRNAPDPVARYLSEASAARTRVAEATALAARRRRAPRIGLRLAAALIVVALLIGILIGNATGGASALRPAAKTQPTAKRHKSPVKNATGSSYLQQEQNLPNTVSP